MKRRSLSKSDKAILISMHGSKCVNCGFEDRIEWHHVVPLEIGGNDTFENMIPLCHECHKAVTHHELVLKTRGRCHDHHGGRPVDLPKGCEDIYTDFVRCRISKTEAAERLGKGGKFIENVAFKDYLKRNNIKKYRNNIDIYLSKHTCLIAGKSIGYIEYMDGKVETMYVGAEEPVSGKSNVPVGFSTTFIMPMTVPRHIAGLYDSERQYKRGTQTIVQDKAIIQERDG